MHYVEQQPKKADVRIWLDIGTTEEAQKTVSDTRVLKDTLIKKGWKSGRDLNYLEAECAEHNERAWSARIEQILTFLFPPK